MKILEEDKLIFQQPKYLYISYKISITFYDNNSTISFSLRLKKHTTNLLFNLIKISQWTSI